MRWDRAVLVLSLIGMIVGQMERCSSPQVALKMSETERQQMQKVAATIQTHAKRSEDDGGKHYIATVFHIVVKDASRNHSMTSILSQLKATNQDFNRLNQDASKTLDQFKPVAGSAGIAFVLATVDPDGNPTTGVVYRKTDVTSFPGVANNNFDHDCMNPNKGGATIWDPKRYLNIVVCNLEDDLGYALGPGSVASIDGVVITSTAFGLTNSKSPYNLGRTVTHEIGHWLALKHTWGDSTVGCNKDDGIADTPLTSGPNLGCQLSANSCGTTAMVQNYMDYADDACMNIFTQGQIERMRSTLVLGGVRSGALVNHTGDVVGLGVEAPEPSTQTSESFVETNKLWFIIGGAGAAGLIAIIIVTVSVILIRRRRQSAVDNNTLQINIEGGL